MKTIKTALISVFNKEGLEPLVKKLDSFGVKIYSTGGTENFIENLGISVEKVEDLTDYPSILGGRVKTLHPKIFGGILSRRDNKKDIETLKEYNIPEIDLVIIDLYPFEKTVEETSNENDIIEKIDIGGISLIRATAKNFNDTVIVPSIDYYSDFLNIIEKNKCATSLEDRRILATKSFEVSSNYDFTINDYFNGGSKKKTLRYGENPHQKGIFKGDLDNIFINHNGKELSYNNLLDVDSAVNLTQEFDEPTFVIIKHNTACGVASRDNIYDAYLSSLKCDPISAFGGILASNREIDKKTAEEINKIFCEVLIAPKFTAEALEILKSKKNIRILEQKKEIISKSYSRTCLNGNLVQDTDLKTEIISDLSLVTKKSVDENDLKNLIFASIICKHTKSNAIVLAKNKTLLSSGTGQTSRIDSLNQAIDKAIKFNFNLKDSVLASDAFFPFPDIVERSSEVGIKSIIQPGGSIKDNLSIDKCNENNISMIFTGVRHFKH